MKNTIFTGMATAIVTPMHTDGSIDYEALSRFVEFQIGSGINGLVVMGTTGENATIEPEDQKKVIAYTVEKVAGRVPVIACPKLDTDGSGTLDRLTALLRGHADAPPASLTVLRMSVPCCAGLDRLAHAAVRRAGLGLIPQTRIVSLG